MIIGSHTPSSRRQFCYSTRASETKTEKNRKKKTTQWRLENSLCVVVVVLCSLDPNEARTNFLLDLCVSVRVSFVRCCCCCRTNALRALAVCVCWAHALFFSNFSSFRLPSTRPLQFKRPHQTTQHRAK